MKNIYNFFTSPPYKNNDLSHRLFLSDSFIWGSLSLSSWEVGLEGLLRMLLILGGSLITDQYHPLGAIINKGKHCPKAHHLHL